MRLAATSGKWAIVTSVLGLACAYVACTPTPPPATCDGGCIDADIDGPADDAPRPDDDGGRDGPVGPKLRLATFGATRAPGYSLASGGSSTRIRAALEQAFPIVWVPVESLEELDAAKADGAILSSWASSFAPLDPPSPAEQAALRAFVEKGRFAVLLLDNDGYGQGKDVASDALAAPFGLGADGTLPPNDGGASTSATFVVVHPAAGGEAALPQFMPGWITLGDASVSPAVLATNAGGPAVSIFERGALAPGAGVVIAFSDNGSFMDDVLDAPTTAARNVLVATLLHASK